MTAKKKQIPDQPESDRPEIADPLNTSLESEAAIDADAESAAAASDTFEQAADDLVETGLEISEGAEENEETAPEAPVQLERLQKILAKSGIASRRHAEELITAGRVQVNGKVVTELGSKADPARDHIRVDGKLLQGSERHRYFMLNKPKGYVTTVSDPEGRPTIMEFFSKTRERLYPVGRLDYLSEGLLLMTNDGELANKLTRAASGVEKTYLVKISGQPSEADLNRLREGVGIAKDKPGSGRVQTAPAEIRPFRPGKPTGKRGPSRPVDNPWYEVVLIEGRNRELRKMFEEIGHHVEKIRRVGYGPLVLDLEPGKIRELEPGEIENLRKASEGKYRKPKPREPRKREFTPRDRPTSKPGWGDRRSEGGKAREFGSREERRPYPANQRGFQQRSDSGGSRRPERNQFRPGAGRNPNRGPSGDSNRESPREFGPGVRRSSPPFPQDRPQRPSRRDDLESRPSTGDRENRRPFGKNRPFQRDDRPKRFGSRPPRREFGAPVQSEGDRSRNRGRFEGRPPQRSDAARPGSPDRSPGKKRLEIRPAEENFENPQSASAPDRQDRRSLPPRTGSRPFAPNRPAGRQRSDQPRFDRPRRDDRGGPGRDNRPPRRDHEDRPRYDRPPAENRGDRRSDERRPPRGDRRSDRETRNRLDRPPREKSGGQRIEGGSGRPDRRSGQRPSASRPSGNFRPGKRGAPGAKSGSTRSGSGRRPNSRPGGNRPKRRP